MRKRERKETNNIKSELTGGLLLGASGPNSTAEPLRNCAESTLVLSMNQEVVSHQTLNLFGPISDFPASKTVRNDSVLFISHLVYGILL